MPEGNELNIFLQKVAGFVKLALDEIEELKDTVQELNKTAAVKNKRDEKSTLSLKKAADALYDLDFITDSIERETFMKKAQENPMYLADVIGKICKSSSVAMIGSPARVAVNSRYSENDPVAIKAFGWNGEANIFDE
jgi:hypothetical protein